MIPFLSNKNKMINHETIYYEIYLCPLKRTTYKNDYIF